MKILTAVYDHEYDLILGMYEDKSLFYLECNEIEEKLRPMSAYTFSRLTLLAENEPKEYAEMIFENRLEEHLNVAQKQYTEFIEEMADSIQEDNPDISRMQAEMEAREYWFE